MVTAYHVTAFFFWWVVSILTWPLAWCGVYRPWIYATFYRTYHEEAIG